MLLRNLWERLLFYFPQWASHLLEWTPVQGIRWVSQPCDEPSNHLLIFVVLDRWAWCGMDHLRSKEPGLNQLVPTLLPEAPPTISHSEKQFPASTVSTSYSNHSSVRIQTHRLVCPDVNSCSPQPAVENFIDILRIGKCVSFTGGRCVTFGVLFLIFLINPI